MQHKSGPKNQLASIHTKEMRLGHTLPSFSQVHLSSSSPCSFACARSTSPFQAPDWRLQCPPCSGVNTPFLGHFFLLPHQVDDQVCCLKLYTFASSLLFLTLVETEELKQTIFGPCCFLPAHPKVFFFISCHKKLPGVKEEVSRQHRQVELRP